MCSETSWEAGFLKSHENVLALLNCKENFEEVTDSENIVIYWWVTLQELCLETFATVTQNVYFKILLNVAHSFYVIGSYGCWFVAKMHFYSMENIWYLRKSNYIHTLLCTHNSQQNRLWTVENGKQLHVKFSHKYVLLVNTLSNSSEYNLEFQGSIRNLQKRALFMKFPWTLPFFEEFEGVPP